VGGLGEGDVDYDWVWDGEQAGAQQVAEGPGCVGGEGWEDEGAVYAVELVEFARGEGDFGCHVFLEDLCFGFLFGRSWRRSLEMSGLYFFVGAMGSL
jgi:hypothetical protein